MKEKSDSVNYFNPAAQAYLLGKLINIYPEKTFHRVYDKIVAGFHPDTEQAFQKILISGGEVRDPHLLRLILYQVERQKQALF